MHEMTGQSPDPKPETEHKVVHILLPLIDMQYWIFFLNKYKLVLLLLQYVHYYICTLPLYRVKRSFTSGTAH